MDLAHIMLSEIGQTEKDKYCMISYVESKKAKLLKHKAKRWLPKAEGWGSRTDVCEDKLTMTSK